MDTPQLIHRLQLLQRRLCEMADDLGNLTDPEIVAVSEEADRLIVQLQRLRREEAEERRRGERVSGPLLSSQSAEEVGEQGSALFLKHS
ncbi:aspartyl-phosphate phosphatase Spo0E family protein [Cohnella caldifontis]|uniref:aspartyl-phosphate phosphatase Spo0E family protein n=1 Tax=Cohnella caldifontis TaxID=3027471 RepID=UPI0023ED3C29|nr:aspartyl-phosphate phosphatase Spo0E family protein [Cohnella sp. YIM B05605]